MEPRVRGVVFDFDGVLVLSEPVHAEAWRDLLRAEGIDLTNEEAEDVIGTSDADFLRRLAAARGLRLDLDALLRRKKSAYESLARARLRPAPGAVEAVQRVAEHLRLPVALATSESRSIAEKILEWIGIRGCFTMLVGYEDTERHKPHPAPYLEAARRLAIPPGRLLAVEDSPAGIASAKAAGLTCLAVEHTFPAARLGAADRVVPSLRDWDAIAPILTAP